MGCDIHFVIEKKYDDRWAGVYYSDEFTFRQETDGQTSIPVEMLDSRNYQFFGLLANVRCNPQPGSEEPRGLPEGVSSLASAEIDEWGGDGHSHSWHSLEEFVKKYLLSNADDVKKAELMAAKLQGENPMHKFLPRVRPETWHKYRIVFWFDN